MFTVSLQQLQADRALNIPPHQGWVAWAVNALAAGEDTPHLRILAGETPPFSAFALYPLLDRLTRELGRPTPTKEDAVAAYATVLVQSLQDDPSSLDALAALASLYNSAGMPDDLYPFYLLYHAADTLRDAGVQHYLPGETAASLPLLVRTHAQAFLEHHPPIDAA